jgi:hypothetical protein
MIIAIPAVLDIIGSTLMLIAMNMCAASVSQMMRGTLVVIIAFAA